MPGLGDGVGLPRLQHGQRHLHEGRVVDVVLEDAQLGEGARLRAYVLDRRAQARRRSPWSGSTAAEASAQSGPKARTLACGSCTFSAPWGGGDYTVGSDVEGADRAAQGHHVRRGHCRALPGRQHPRYRHGGDQHAAPIGVAVVEAQRDLGLRQVAGVLHRAAQDDGGARLWVQVAHHQPVLGHGQLVLVVVAQHVEAGAARATASVVVIVDPSRKVRVAGSWV